MFSLQCTDVAGKIIWTREAKQELTSPGISSARLNAKQNWKFCNKEVHRPSTQTTFSRGSMPLMRNVRLELKNEEVLRREGLGRARDVKPKIKNLILELLATVEQAHLLEPAIAYELYPIKEAKAGELLLEGKGAGRGLRGSKFPQASELAILVCTIGPKLEEKVRRYSMKGETLRAMLLDGIGSAAVDALVERACQFIADIASTRGLQASSPIYPGMPGLPLSEQRRLLKLVPAQEIGVSLTRSGMMVPLKSISMVIGLGAQMPFWSKAAVCTQCHLNETCPYKVVTQEITC